jgi:hypothetical protein
MYAVLEPIRSVITAQEDTGHMTLSAKLTARQPK